VGNFIIALRRSFKNQGQIMATSHNVEAIRKFSMDNTFLLYRKNHLEPSLIKLLDEITDTNNFIDRFIRGDIKP
jgi:hypothetical protein